ncbi:hypothetical protein ENFAE_18010 [Enterococcus faecalis]|nr:hypothetical protein ENFAE_18010 [Enterococcus faecalis]
MEKKQITLRQEQELNDKLKFISERSGLDIASLITLALISYITYLGFVPSIFR